MQDKTLIERLGLPSDSSAVILNIDDLGMCHASTEIGLRLLSLGLATSATTMTPCPWFPYVADACRATPKLRIGVHITLNSEWRIYRWRPLSGSRVVPSLVDGNGFFHAGLRALYTHARLPEVEKEVRLQIETALGAGIDVTHLDSHMGAMQLHPTYHELYLQLAAEYRLPCRMADPALMERFRCGYLFGRARGLGVLHPDFLVLDEASGDATRLPGLDRILPGRVTEIPLHPAMDASELRAIMPTWQNRTQEAQSLEHAEHRKSLCQKDVQMISYMEIRDIQRAQ